MTFGEVPVGLRVHRNHFYFLLSAFDFTVGERMSTSDAKLKLPPLDIARVSEAAGRAVNEDSVAIHPRLDHLQKQPPQQVLVFVADGMGGGDIGGGLSQQAVSFAVQSLSKPADPSASKREQLERAYQLANQALKNFLDLKDMDERYFKRGGSTMVGAMLEKTPAGVTAHIANIGDSRAYLLRDGVLTQLTTDHNYLNQLIADGVDPKIAAHDDQAERLTHRLGLDADMREVPHFYAEHALQPRDTLLFCTDGLTRYVSQEHLVHSLSKPSAQEAVQSLLKAAKQGRTKDNVSAVVVRYAKPPVTKTFPWIWLIAGLLLVGLAIGGVAFALNQNNAVTPTSLPTLEPTVTNIPATVEGASPQPVNPASGDATVTLAPFPTNTPTPTPTPTPTNTPTPRPTRIPPTRIPPTRAPVVVPPTAPIQPTTPAVVSTDVPTNPPEPPTAEPPTSSPEPPVEPSATP